MDKNVVIGILYEFYGKLLTDKQSEAIELHYLEDLSLTEIADIQNISKQSVSETIKRSEKILFDFEEKLGVYKKTKTISDLIEKLDKNLKTDLLDNYEKYKMIIEEIKSKIK